MATDELKPGERVTWLHVPRGGYGYVVRVPATVVKAGPRRVTVDAQLAAGGTKRVTITHGALVRTRAEARK